MELGNQHIETAYFIGIGGIGMSALARYFHAQGVTVSGYDRTQTTLTRNLVSEGIAVHYNDQPELIPQQPGIVVYTPAVPADMAELVHCHKAGYTVKKRAEVLGMLTQSTRTIAIAGTHGKTTTSCMVAHIMKHANASASAFLGGISVNYNSNLVLATNSHTTVVEADEFDRSFLQLYPDLAVITSMDADHLDIYGEHDELTDSFTAFGELVTDSLVLKSGLQLMRSVKANVTSYGIEVEADYSATQIRIKGGRYSFDLQTPTGTLHDIALGIPGRHNVENAVAAIAITQKAGIASEQIKEALASFKGIKRRFEYIIQTDDLVFVDDYAHHPTELSACIGSLREMYPAKKITGIFQPHLFSRTRDFATEFSAALDQLDEIILLDIYPAREQPIPGVSSQMLLDMMTAENSMLCPKTELVAELQGRKLEVLVTLGAGDIDQLVEPIREGLSQPTIEA